MYFMQAYEKDSTNAFVNYQIAASLLKQNDKYKAEEAKKYLQNAVRLNPALKVRFDKEFSGQSTKPQQTANNNTNSTKKGLTGYIEDLKYSRSTGGNKTSMNSAGLDVLYGYEYFEKGDMELATIRLKQAVAKAPEDIYASYLLGLSLNAQGLKQEAAPYLNKAFAADAKLKEQFTTDLAAATSAYNKLNNSRKIKTTPASKPVYGGKLVFGNYTCTETVWNGPNASQPYSFPTKGYFELKSNGTYRWLDNGTTGKYSYNEKTGEIKWLSGYLANMQAKTSQYQGKKQIPQITVNFSADYRWECGCDKK
jgi:tetratricopeptide (TPR) repeat protein